MPRTIIGLRGDGQFGIFVAKPGHDATWGEDSLYFSMGRAQGQVIAAGNIYIYGNGTASTHIFPRTLTQRPYVDCRVIGQDPPQKRIRIDVKLDRFHAYYLPRGSETSGDFWASFIVAATKGYY